MASARSSGKTISADDQLLDAASWRELIVRWSGEGQGSPIRLGDIATVHDGVENENVAGWFDDEPSVSVVIRREPGANIIATVDRVRALLPALRSLISPAIDLSIVLDRTTTIRDSVRDVEIALGSRLCLWCW